MLVLGKSSESKNSTGAFKADSIEYLSLGTAEPGWTNQRPIKKHASLMRKQPWSLELLAY